MNPSLETSGLGPQDWRRPPAKCGAHRVNCQNMISSTNIRWQCISTRNLVLFT